MSKFTKLSKLFIHHKSYKLHSRNIIQLIKPWVKYADRHYTQYIMYFVACMKFVEVVMIDESVFLKLDQFVHSYLLQVHANFQAHTFIQEQRYSERCVKVLTESPI